MSQNSHLSEPDARAITRAVVTHLREMGAHVTDFGISLDSDGFWLIATINGRTISCRTSQGTFTYKGVAADMLHRALSPDPEPDQAIEIMAGRA